MSRFIGNIVRDVMADSVWDVMSDMERDVMSDTASKSPYRP
jgi:hypothetical protein